MKVKPPFLTSSNFPFLGGSQVWRYREEELMPTTKVATITTFPSSSLFVCVCGFVCVSLSLLRLQPSSLQAINIVPFSRASSRVPLLCRHRTLSGPCTRTLPIERMIALILRTAINWRRQISRISLDPGCFEIRPAFEAQISHAERFG